MQAVQLQKSSKMNAFSKFSCQHDASAPLLVILSRIEMEILFLTVCTTGVVG